MEKRKVVRLVLLVAVCVACLTVGATKGFDDSFESQEAAKMLLVFLAGAGVVALTEKSND